MTGFPKLIPAFTALIPIEAPTPVGTNPVASGNSLVHVIISPNGGSIKSEPDYPIKLDAEFVHGADFIRADPSGKNVRLEVHSVIRDRLSGGGLLRLNYTGIISTEGPNGKVLGGKPDAATTPHGDAFMSASFETGVPELVGIQNKVYVGSGRFILEEGKPVIVEYKISEVSY